MIYYKDDSGDVYAYDSADEYTKHSSRELIEMTESEVDDMINQRGAWAPVLTYAQELTALTAPYNADRDTLCAAWLRAAVADGTEETVRKEDVESEIAELDAQYDADVAALKTKYGVS